MHTSSIRQVLFKSRLCDACPSQQQQQLDRERGIHLSVRPSS
ncbi:hypothetical protein M3J09_008027 [Ascochyta lentis]